MNKIKATAGIGTFTLMMLMTGSIDSIRNLPATALFGPSLIFFAIGAALSGLIANSMGVSDGASIGLIEEIAFWLFAGFVPIAIIGNIFAWRFVRS